MSSLRIRCMTKIAKLYDMIKCAADIPIKRLFNYSEQTDCITKTINT